VIAGTRIIVKAAGWTGSPHLVFNGGILAMQKPEGIDREQVRWFGGARVHPGGSVRWHGGWNCLVAAPGTIIDTKIVLSPTNLRIARSRRAYRIELLDEHGEVIGQQKKQAPQREPLQQLAPVEQRERVIYEVEDRRRHR
jgi:hypothetical protein